MTARRPRMNGDRCQRGSALAPLSREQKTALVLLAKDAFEKTSPGVDFDTFRQNEALRAVGRQISTARNEDYLRIKAHFLDLMGRAGAAFQAHMRAEEDPRRQAMHALIRECRASAAELPDAIGYARGFLTRKGTSLEDASPNQIWHALFTIRRKVQGLRHKARGTKRQPQPVATDDDNCPF